MKFQINVLKVNSKASSNFPDSFLRKVNSSKEKIARGTEQQKASMKAITHTTYHDLTLSSKHAPLEFMEIFDVAKN